MVKYRQNADYLYIMIEQLKYDAWLLKGTHDYSIIYYPIFYHNCR